MGQMKYQNELAYNNACYMIVLDYRYCVHFLGMDTFGVIWC